MEKTNAKSKAKKAHTKSKIAIVALCAAIMIGGGLIARAVKPPADGDASAMEQASKENPATVEPAAGL